MPYDWKTRYTPEQRHGGVVGIILIAAIFIAVFVTVFALGFAFFYGRV